jgi:hypothetical protein
MEMTLSKDDLELHEAFGVILSIESFSDYISDIAELIYNNELSRGNLDTILTDHKILRVEDIKEELLDLLIVYINLILNDHIISEKEKRNIGLLKIYFKIKEGDFYNIRYYELEDILQRQFERLYLDNSINSEEALHNVDLQDFFDLSYDQFDEFKEKEVRKALELGANISELDTAKYPKVYKTLNDDAGRSISQQVKDLVWNRDNGKCSVCGSNEKLEFDHIIPFSKGGSNTYRNIQLLCELCNRTKTNKIG